MRASAPTDAGSLAAIRHLAAHAGSDALRSDGTVLARGSDSYGELGAGAGTGHRGQMPPSIVMSWMTWYAAGKSGAA
jgi:hypothetical protein